MRVIVPQAINLLSTNVTAPSEAEWSSATTYGLGDLVKVTTATPHRIYRSLRGNNTNRPPATWLTPQVEIATSTTSNAVEIGEKTFTVQTGKGFSAGMIVAITKTATPRTVNMTGEVVSYTSGTGALVVAVYSVTGTGTHAAWTVASEDQIGFWEEVETTNQYRMFDGYVNTQTEMLEEITVALGTIRADYVSLYGLEGKEARFTLRDAGAETAETWTSRNAISGYWRSICWSPELRLFCAVSTAGTGNRVMTSPDGITWTGRNHAAENNWYSVCWAAELGLFCAVALTGSGSGNRVMTSPDGITWTARGSATDNGWYSVCWSPELSLFCAVSPTGTATGDGVMTSPDGITWTARTAAADNDWFSICWSPELELFCAVSASGTGNRVMTSPDGITWTSRSSAANNYWYSVCWSPELSLFCAVSSTGTGNRVMTSPDGITWTSRSAAYDYQWHSVCWSAELGLFCAVANAGGDWDGIMISADGITWSLRMTDGLDYNWMGVCWSPGLGIFCAVSMAGSASSGVMTGADPLWQSTVDLAYGSATVASISDWYEYFFGEYDRLADIDLEIPIPIYSGILTISILADTGETAKCGMVLLGRASDIGIAFYGASAGMVDFSQRTTDTLGRTTLSQGYYAKRNNLRVVIPNYLVDSVFKLLTSLRGIPTAWIGNNDGEAYESKRVYGAFRSFNIVFEGVNRSGCDIEIEGLI